MRISVIEGRCEGHGLCESTAPGVFALDDDGFVRVLQESVEAELHDDARRGARSCPMAALSVVDP